MMPWLAAAAAASAVWPHEPSSEPAKDNYGSLISALQSGKLTVDLTTITETTVVNIVTVTSL